MVVYIAGAMAGVEDYKDKFAKAQKSWMACGNIVINPATLPQGLSDAAYMPICLKMIDAADEVYMLKGWEESKGARIEEAYARYQGKEVSYEG